MNIIGKITLFFTVSVTAAGCSHKLYPPRDVTESRTVVTEIRDRDTLVAIPADSAIVTARVVNLPEGRLIIRDIRAVRSSSRISIQLDIDSKGVLTSKAVVDSGKVMLAVKDRVTTENVNKAETITQTVEVNVLLWWQKALIWLGVAMLAVIMVCIIKFIIKLRLNGVQSILSIFNK